MAYLGPPGNRNPYIASPQGCNPYAAGAASSTVTRPPPQTAPTGTQGRAPDEEDDEDEEGDDSEMGAYMNFTTSTIVAMADMLVEIKAQLAALQVTTERVLQVQLQGSTHTGGATIVPGATGGDQPPRATEP